MTEIAIPRRVARRPRDRVGRPVPWFVAWPDGVPDFRLIAEGRIEQAVQHHRCWVCGKTIEPHHANVFVVGPMCAVNRTSAEPPSHKDCAIYSATHCPFLAKPHMRRREAGLPDEIVAPAGIGLKRNPGVALVWVSQGWRLFPDGRGGQLFDIGEPREVLWFAEGRQASRAEVQASVDSGLPTLEAMCDKEREVDRAPARAALAAQVARLMPLLPR